MHHSESAGESASIRKMAHPAIFPRKGSNTGSSSASTLTTAASASVSNNIIPTEDYQSPLVIQPPPPAGSSSPGPQHHPQSLNLISQSQLHSQTLQAGAQVKKKSGFQITSVTPAQISVSTNNSITEDTESCDDLDESHTEDLSSSEILDVSLSRATDFGGPERSSSEETLNNFHEADTPGAVSPNQPPHPLPHGTQHRPMVNGTAHPHQQQSHSHHPHLGHRHQVPSSQPTSGLPVGGGVSVAGTSTSGALSGVTQKLPTGLVAAAENAHVNKSLALAQPVAASSSGTGMPSMPAVAAVNMANPSISNVGGVNMLRSSGRSLSAGLVNTKIGNTGMDSSSLNVNSMQQQSAAQAAAMTTAVVGPPGMMRSAVAGVSLAPAVKSAPPQQAPAPAPNPGPPSASSRFRVVKLDSNSEPFKKGRWTCTEFYDKEAPPPEGGAPVHRAADSLRQPVAEGASGACSEPGHHGENAEAQQAFQPPPGIQNPLLGVSRAHVIQDVGVPKSAAAQPVPSTLGMVQHQQAVVNQGAQQPALAAQQQLAYMQPGQSAQAGYPPSAQQLAPAHVMATAQHQPMAQAGVRAPHPHPPSHLTPLSVGGQPVVSMPSAVAQPLPQGHQQPASQVIPPQALSVTQPRPLPVPAEQQLPSRTQYPGSQPPPAFAGALGQAAAAGLPFERKPGPAQGLPSLTATQLEDAQRFLFQHQSLLSLPKLGAGERASGAGSALGPENSGRASALPAGAGLFPLKSLPVDGEEDSSSGASVVAIDNKIEQAMDLVKSHLMYAVREEVEVLKEQIKELIERNSQLEQENNLLKNLASPEQLAQFQAQVQSGSPPPSAQPAGTGTQLPAPPAQTASQTTVPSA